MFVCILTYSYVCRHRYQARCSDGRISSHSYCISCNDCTLLVWKCSTSRKTWIWRKEGNALDSPAYSVHGSRDSHWGTCLVSSLWRKPNSGLGRYLALLLQHDTWKSRWEIGVPRGHISQFPIQLNDPSKTIEMKYIKLRSFKHTEQGLLFYRWRNDMMKLTSKA